MQAGISTFDLMTQRLRWLEARQGVLARNIANADTPGFRPSDVAPFAAGGTTALVTTSSAHIGGNAAGGAGTVSARRLETRPNGNAVSLEDEVLKIGETQMEHQALTGLYQRSLLALKTAIGRKG